MSSGRGMLVLDRKAGKATAALCQQQQTWVTAAHSRNRRGTRNPLMEWKVSEGGKYKGIWEIIFGGSLFAGDAVFMLERSL